MKILAIETSCDDTGIAILETLGDLPSRKASARRSKKSPDFNVLSDIIASQVEVHKKYGGVFPMMAKREHQKNLVPVLIKSLKKAKLLKAKNKNDLTPNTQNLTPILEREPELCKKLILFLKKHKKPDVDLIAVTNGPGLEPCLWVGVNFARALSYFWNIPVVPVNHIEAHILVNFLNGPVDRSTGLPDFPAVCLVASGGHTQLILMKKIGDYEILGETRDDAAGECFDKAAKILGLGYPGGPAIAALAAKFERTLRGASNRNSKFEIHLPRPMMNTKDYDFSFSGLKTAVLYAVRGKKQAYMNFNDRSKSCTLNYNYKYKQGMAAEIQQAVIDVLIKKTIKAAKNFRAKAIILGGGVSANQELRRQFELKTNGPNASGPFSLVYPPANLSTDNAVMVAIAGYFHSNNKASCDIGSRTKLKADANLRIDE